MECVYSWGMGSEEYNMFTDGRCSQQGGRERRAVCLESERHPALISVGHHFGQHAAQVGVDRVAPLSLLRPHLPSGRADSRVGKVEREGRGAERGHRERLAFVLASAWLFSSPCNRCNSACSSPSRSLATLIAALACSSEDSLASFSLYCEEREEGGVVEGRVLRGWW